MEAVLPMVRTSFCASAAEGTSRATMRRSRAEREGLDAGGVISWKTLPPASLTALLATRQVLRHLHLFGLHDVEADLEQSAIFGVEEHLGRSVGEVDDARFRHGTTIIHPHHDPAAVVHVRDL